MRRTLGQLGLVMMFLGGLVLAGCSGSGSDPLKEIGYRYFIDDIDVQDRGESTTDIDIVEDCPGGGSPITKSTIDITFRSQPDALQDIYLYRIRFDYELDSWEGFAFQEPFIETVTYDRTLRIPGRGGMVSESFDLFTIAQKIKYVNDIGVDAAAVFQVRITAFLTYTPQSRRNDQEVHYDYTINVANYIDGSCPDVD